MPNPTQLLEVDIRLVDQLGDRMLGEYFRRQPLGGRFRCNRLGPVLTELGSLTFTVGARPGAVRTIESVFLIQLEESLKARSGTFP